MDPIPSEGDSSNNSSTLDYFTYKDDYEAEVDPPINNTASPPPQVDPPNVEDPPPSVQVNFSEEFHTNQSWTDRESMLNWARSVGRKKNMVLTIAKSRPRNARKLGNVLLACEKYGKYRSGKNSIDQRSDRTKATRTKKSHCPFALYGREVELNVWELQVRCGFHNHNLPPNLLGHAFAGKLTKDELSLVRDLSEAGGKPKPILRSLKMANPENVTSRKQLYNARWKLGKEWSNGRTVMQQLLHLLSKYDYFESNRLVPGSEELDDLVFAHKESLELLRLFPYVLIMDTTYKTNRYKMPFLEIVGFTSTLKTFAVAFAWMGAESAEHYEWVLNEIKLICPSPPLAILTDRELGLIKALDRVDTDRLWRASVQELGRTTPFGKPWRRFVDEAAGRRGGIFAAVLAFNGGGSSVDGWCQRGQERIKRAS